jgi:hypothetical protein
VSGTVDRDAAATAGTWAAQQAYKLGAEQERARLRDPHAAYALGHDVGYSANTADRAYVSELMRGFEDGCRARRGLVEDLQRHDREGARAAREAQPEAEAG